MDFDLFNEALEERNGILYWKRSRSRTVAGTEAGYINKDGYIQIGFMRRTYVAHRIVWLLRTGAAPTSLIDHKNRIKTDNRFENLRLATLAQNAVNTTKRKRNKYRGVSYRTENKAYQAVCGGKYLGLFATEEEAALAYDAHAMARYDGYAVLNLPGSQP